MMRFIKPALMFALVVAVFSMPHVLRAQGRIAGSEPTVTPGIFKGWGYYTNGYSLKLPPDWKAAQKNKGLTVFTPGRSIGGLKEISVNIPPGTSNAGAPFSTQEEFDEWYTGSLQTKGTVRRIDDIMLDGVPAVMLADVGTDSGEWIMEVWVRKDDRNIYVRAKGNGRQGVAEAEAFDYLLSSFLFGP